MVKGLASVFHTRIELRQIGVRDKAKMVGGLGICGRPFCCATFLDDFQPVSIKMAKTQNLSLNPTKISGTCGRLMCCLKYEQDAYEDLLNNAPKAESFVDTPEGRGTVVEVDLLRSRVKVRLEDQPENIITVANSELAVLRSGKAKKNDLPIPADLAPISGNGKKEKQEPEERPRFLDPIKFRYTTETLVEEPELEEENEGKEEGTKRSHRRRNRAKNRENASEEQQEAVQAEDSTEEAVKKPKKPHHYRRHHRRRPQKQGE